MITAATVWAIAGFVAASVGSIEYGNWRGEQIQKKYAREQDEKSQKMLNDQDAAMKKTNRENLAAAAAANAKYDAAAFNVRTLWGSAAKGYKS
jgi:hypothetical protein